MKMICIFLLLLFIFYFYLYLMLLLLLCVLVSSTYLRQRNLDPDRRRQSLGTIIPHRASDAFLDPNHAAILFRDSRGVCFH